MISEKVPFLEDWIRCRITIKVNRKPLPWLNYRFYNNLRMMVKDRPDLMKVLLIPWRNQNNSNLILKRKLRLGKRVKLIGLTWVIFTHTKRPLIRQGKRSLSATFFAAIGLSISFHNRLFSCIPLFSEVTQDTVTLLPDVWVLFAFSST